MVLENRPPSPSPVKVSAVSVAAPHIWQALRVRKSGSRQWRVARGPSRPVSALSHEKPRQSASGTFTVRLPSQPPTGCAGRVSISSHPLGLLRVVLGR